MSRTVVAMSGGIDSCAAALLLQEQGIEVCGVSLRILPRSASASVVHGIDNARQFAAKLQIPFFEFDLRECFRSGVIEPFVQAYLSGITPNPCIDCNRIIKFAELRRRANESFNTDLLATGHYAQIRSKPDGGYALFSSVDPSKDQSYFLYFLGQSELSQTKFPVGGMTKNSVREVLSDHGFSFAERAESQDVCFISGSTSDFIEGDLYSRGEAAKPGILVDAAGRTVGTHGGIHRFTVGQRRGLGIGGDRKPLYVLEIDGPSGHITVGERKELERSSFFVSDLHWISGQPKSGEVRALTKLRYRHGGVICSLYPLSEGRGKVEFITGWSAVSPGQAAVFYKLEAEEDGTREVLGGGVITK